MRNFNKAVFIASAALCLNLSAFSQNISFSVKDATVKEAMEQLKKSSGYSFVFSSSDVDTNKRVSISSQNSSIKDIVKQILQGQSGLDYEIQGKKIIIKKLSVKASSNHTNQTAQGKVVDVNGEPIIGAAIMEVGTTNGTITDFDGNFSLSVATNGKVAISYVGYKTKEVKITDSKPLNIVLTEDTEVLSEVVVTALGIKKEAKSLSYNVQQVDNSEITRVADANFVNNLNGKIAGVTINSSSSGVGGSSRVVMRGAKSLNGNNNALYVVDGIPMLDMSAANEQPSDAYEGAGLSGDPISGLNPEDIESISVLSGPSAAALYGSAAANGVVMVTTKKGHEGRTSLTISNNTTFSAPLVLPEFQNTYGPSETGSFYSWGSKLQTPSSYDPSDFFQTGVNVTNSASLSTGTSKNQTYLSIGTTNAKGIIHNNNYERYNATVRNVSKMLKDKLTLDLSFMLSSVKEQNMTAQGLYFNPLVPLYLFPAGDDFSKIQAYQRYDVERNLLTQYWPYSDGLSLQNPY